MALSNIRNEPRREITESVLGIIVFIVVLWGDYWLVNRFNLYFSHPRLNDLIIGMICLPIFLGLVWLGLYGLAHFTHDLGEEICAWMSAMKVDPRPKQRYRK